MIERGEHFNQIAALLQTLDANRTLTRRRQTFFGFQASCDPRIECETLQSRHRENDGGVLALVELAQPGLYIAPQRGDIQGGIAGAQLTFPPETGGADACPC